MWAKVIQVRRIYKPLFRVFAKLSVLLVWSKELALRQRAYLGFVIMLQAIEKPFLQSVKEILGDHFSPTMEDLYARTTHFILYMLVMAFNEVTAIPNGDQGR